VPPHDLPQQGSDFFQQLRVGTGIAVLRRSHQISEARIFCADLVHWTIIIGIVPVQKSRVVTVACSTNSCLVRANRATPAVIGDGRRTLYQRAKIPSPPRGITRTRKIGCSPAWGQAYFKAKKLKTRKTHPSFIPLCHYSYSAKYCYQHCGPRCWLSSICRRMLRKTSDISATFSANRFGRGCFSDVSSVPSVCLMDEQIVASHQRRVDTSRQTLGYQRRQQPQGRGEGRCRESKNVQGGLS
jgi:hypothetical protein